jgi:hypothetical protein
MTDPIVKGISRLAYQFKSSEKFKDFLEAFLLEYQELQISELQLLNERYLDTATGKRLDGIGEIVGLERPVESIDVVGAFGFYGDPTALGFTTLSDLLQGGNFVSFDSLSQPIGDDLYRLLLRAKIIENHSAMTVDETTRLISFTFGNISVRYFLHTNLQPIYEIYKLLNDFEANIVSGFPLLIGLGNVTYKTFDSADPFGFYADNEAFGFATISEPDTNLLGFWPFKDGSGTVAQDVSDNANDGTLEGGASWVTDPYIDIPWIEFDGVDGRVDCGNSAPIATLGAGSFSVSFDFKISTTINSFPRFFDKFQDSNNSFALYYYVAQNRFRLNAKVGGVNKVSNFNLLPIMDGTRRSVVFVWNQTTKQALLYVDAVFISAIDISTWSSNISNTGNFSWGGTNVGASPLQGFLGLCRVYDGILTQNGVDILYNYPNNTFGGKFATLIS